MGNDRWLLLVIILLGAALQLLSTRTGIGLNVDAKVYWEGAENISTHQGYRSFDPWAGALLPVTRWPPGTSAVLSLLAGYEEFPDTALRLLYAAMLIFNIILFYLLVAFLVPQQGVQIAATFIFATHPSMISVHFGIYSEPFFLCCTLLGLYFFFRYLTQHGSLLLGLAAVLIGTSVLFRLAGLFTIGGVGLFMLYETLAGKKESLKRTSLFIALALLPGISWLAGTWDIDSGFSGRQMMVYGEKLLQVRRIMAHIFSWLNPYLNESVWSKLFKVGGIVLICYLALPVWHVVRRRKATVQSEPGIQSICVLTLLIFTYLLGYTALVFLLDPTATSDERTLLPVGIYVLLLLSTAYPQIKPILIRDALRKWSAGLLLAIFVLLNLAFTIQQTYQHYQWGIELNAEQWRQSAILQQLRAYPDEVKIYSNETAAIYFHTGRKAQLVPEKRAYFSNAPTPDLAADVAQMQYALQENGLIVIFREYEQIRSRWLPSGAELEELLSLELVANAEEGIIYRLRREVE